MLSVCVALCMCAGFVTMCVKNVLTAGIFTIKLTASFVAPPFLLQTKTNQTCSMSRAVWSPRGQLATVCHSVRHYEECSAMDTWLIDSDSPSASSKMQQTCSLVVWTCHTYCTLQCLLGAEQIEGRLFWPVGQVDHSLCVCYHLHIAALSHYKYMFVCAEMQLSKWVERHALTQTVVVLVPQWMYQKCSISLL